MMELKKLEILEKIIGGLVKEYSHSLVVVSPAGHGKTETTIKTLERNGLREGKEYLYVNSYITPLEFYKELERVNNLNEPKILTLDDCEDILNNVKLISLLKGALWELPDGSRKVSWFSTSPKVQSKSFYFKGKIILLLNRFSRNNPLLNAVADRGFYYNYRLSNSEIISLIKERAKKFSGGLSQSQREKIIRFLEREARNSEKLSLRTLPKAYALFKTSPNSYQFLLKKLLLNEKN